MTSNQPADGRASKRKAAFRMQCGVSINTLLWQISRLRSHGAQTTAELITLDSGSYAYDRTNGRTGSVQHETASVASPAWKFTTAGAGSW